MIEQAQNTFIDLAVKFGPKAAVAALILIVGFYAGRWVAGVFNRSLGRFHLEPPVRILLVRGARLSVFILFLVMALQNLGVDLLPLIAGVGVAGAGVALAMQGVLGNLAAGLTIIFTRPFRVGEYVSMVGVEGRVDAIELFSTTLSHADASRVIVPNRKIVGEILHNYGQIRQLKLMVPVHRPQDVTRALAAVEEVVKSNPRVLVSPAALTGISRLDDSSIVIAVGPWVNVDDYVAANAEINRAILDRFQAGGVSYPAPPEVRLISAD
jgi:small conductance mechanosensitive channel